MFIEIYWDDLTEEKQNELLNLFGCNMNWDNFPIACVEMEDATEEVAE